jgi:hypothetical protein
VDDARDEGAYIGAGGDLVTHGTRPDLDTRLERALARVNCGACRAPKALGDCRHAIVTDERVVLSRAEWQRLVDELTTLRTLDAQLEDLDHDPNAFGHNPSVCSICLA